jgi:hypothetical protein
MAMTARGRRIRVAALLVPAIMLGIAYELYLLMSAQRFNAALERGAFLEAGQRTMLGRFAKAYGLQQRGEFEQTLLAYGEVEPRDAELAAAVRFNMANLYLRQALTLGGEQNDDLAIPLIELAKENYRALLRLNSRDWDAKYNLERALSLLPDPAEQESEADIMPERSPRATTAMPARGELP